MSFLKQTQAERLAAARTALAAAEGELSRAQDTLMRTVDGDGDVDVLAKASDAVGKQQQIIAALKERVAGLEAAVLREQRDREEVAYSNAIDQLESSLAQREAAATAVAKAHKALVKAVRDLDDATAAVQSTWPAGVPAISPIFVEHYFVTLGGAMRRMMTSADLVDDDFAERVKRGHQDLIEVWRQRGAPQIEEAA